MIQLLMMGLGMLSFLEYLESLKLINGFILPHDIRHHSSYRSCDFGHVMSQAEWSFAKEDAKDNLSWRR